MQVILPVGGVGKRFDGYALPKPLMDCLGKPVIFRVLDNIGDAEIHIPYNSLLSDFDFENIVKRAYPEINFYCIDFRTRGSAETVYAALNNFSGEQLAEHLLVMDADNIYQKDILQKSKGNCIFYFEDKGDKPIYSYIAINNGLVTNIAEKIKISDNANCGVYGFSSGLLAKVIIGDILGENKKSKGEFYLSCVYSKMLEQKNIVYAIKIDEFYSLGTPELLRTNELKYAEIYNLPTPPRRTNKIEMTSDVVIKNGDVDGQIYYYHKMPEDIKKYHPKLITFNYGDFLITEKIDGITYSQLYINNCFVFSYLDKLFDYLKEVHCFTGEPENIYANYYQKTITRMDGYLLNDVQRFDTTKNEVLDFLDNYEKKKSGKQGMIHGDTVFTNIILDNDNNIKLVDMRGKQGGKLSVYGDIYYDYAKVWQSLIGYDEVLLGKKCNKYYKDCLKDYFRLKFINLFGADKFEEIRWLTKGLLLSLLPIHNNEKCQEYFELIEKV